MVSLRVDTYLNASIFEKETANDLALQEQAVQAYF
jgi:hypothetical protein